MPVPAFFRKALGIAVPALSLLLCSCGSTTAFYGSVDEHLARGSYREAIENVRSNRNAYGDKSTVLYNLDLGALYHYAGEPDSSNRYLFAAEREIEDLYTKSISLAAMSMLLNDNVLPYDGEDFERVLLNVFLALNYVELGQPDEALVEARKVDLKLREYAREYEGKNRYKEDAFIRYVAGALYETDGEINDAFISYRNAFETYKTYAKEYGTPAPRFLLDDLVRSATLNGFTAEAREYMAQGGKPAKRADVKKGSVFVLAYAGKGPLKQEIRPQVTIPDTAGTLHTFQIALPKFVPRMKNPRSYLVSVQGKKDSTVRSSMHTELAEDITAIAGRALEDRLSLIYLKSGGRALIKFLAAEKAKSELKKKEDKLVNILGSIAVDAVVGATEQADLRTWRTLPAEIQIARMQLAAGGYVLTVAADDGQYTLRGVDLSIAAGKTSFIIVDDIR